MDRERSVMSEEFQREKGRDFRERERERGAPRERVRGNGRTGAAVLRREGRGKFENFKEVLVTF